MNVKRACLFPNEKKEGCKTTALSYAGELKRHGVEVVMPSSFRDEFGSDFAVYKEADEAFSLCDIAVVFGGDGTILSYAPLAAKHDVPLLCVNLGTLGYLTELEPDECGMIASVFDDDFRIDERMMLDGTVIRDGKNVFGFSALNEIVTSRGAVSKIVGFDVCCNGKTALSYRADAIILSTATGSTAYAMASGGPLVDPSLDVICLCPVCAHTLALSRPVILDKDSVTEITVHPSPNADIWVNGDGKPGFRLFDGDTVIVRKSEMKLKLIRIKPRTFFDTLSKKLIKRG